eukprot:sb/3464489/
MDLDNTPLDQIFRRVSSPVLERIILLAQQELVRRKKFGVPKKDPSKYVTFHGRGVPEVDSESLHWEVEDFKQKNTWLSNTGLGYGWGKVQLPPVDIAKYPNIMGLMGKLNSELGCGYNSCLVTRYRNGEGVHYHSDFEDTLDDSSSITVVNLGSPGKVDFIPYLGDGRARPSLTINLKDGEAYTMLKGCQEHFKHRANKAEQGVRYALSFRKRLSTSPSLAQSVAPQPMVSPVVSPVVSQMTFSPVPPMLDGYQPDVSGIPTAAPQSAPNSPRTLLLGTSMTKWVNEDLDVINVSVSGARLCRPYRDWQGSLTIEMLKEFRERQPELVVSKVIVAVGTNDIRNWRNFVRSHRGKKDVFDAYVELVREIRNMFGKSTEIVLATVIPLRPDYGWTASNVFMFNRIVTSVVRSMKCVGVDWTLPFLNRELDFNNDLFSNDGVHLNSSGYNVLNEILYEELMEK